MPPKTTIRYKGKSKRVPKQYVPDTLSASDRKLQVASLVSGTKRPKVTTAKPRRSSHVIAFENKFGYPITSARVAKDIITPTGRAKILDKGRGAYYSGGSRPGQTADSWAFARLASVIMGGPARKVDMDIWDRYKR
jgi:hypothetical protein